MNNTYDFSNNNNNSQNIPPMTYYYETNPNINTISNPNETLNNNGATLIQPQISFEPNLPSISNTIDKYKLQIMEKDRLLIDYKKKEKDLNKEITKLKLSLSSKDDEIFRLEDRLQELLHNLKNSENINEKKYTEMNETTKNYNDKINEMMHENQNLRNTINKLNSVIESHEETIKEAYLDKQKKDEEIISLKEELKKKENLIDVNFNKKQILINENKQLPSLKAKIDDLEKIILELKDEIVGLRDINDKLLEEKNELNEIINKKENEIQKNRIFEQNLINLNNKNMSLNKEIQKKGNDIKSLDDRYLSLLNNNETFIHIFTNELGNFLNYLESINMNNLTSFNNNTFKLPLHNLPNFEHTKLDDNFMIKYEVLSKCILQIEEKITDILNICKKNINKMNYDLIKNEERSKGILNEKNLIQKENFSLKNKITDITQESNDKDLNFEKMNADLSAAHTQNQKLKKDNEDLKYKNTILDKEYQRLINDIDNKLIQFPIKSFDNYINASSFMNNDGKENFNNVTTLTTNKVIHKIDSLIYLNKEINKQLSDTNRENKMCKDKINDLQNENFLMKDKIQNYEENVQKEINNFKNRKENEYNETKEVLFNKIKTLNNILEQGNKLIKTYELEVADLKNKNSKLEFNLKMLTQSHKELEDIVNNKDKSLKEQIDMKDNHYQNLERELQLKDLQIKSLEKLLAQYQGQQNQDQNEEENMGNNYNNVNPNANENNNPNFNDNESVVSFARDDFREMQLNKMIKNFEAMNKLNNDADMGDNQGNINNNNFEDYENENNSGNINPDNANMGINIDNAQQAGNMSWNNQREPGKIIFKK